jgi:Protein of unknown function (DUF2911)
MKYFLPFAIALLTVCSAFAQQDSGAPLSPPEIATGAIAGKTITIHYSAPSVRGRKIFGPDGIVMNDSTAPIWRAGANTSTSFHTDANLLIGGLAVPKGDYTLYVNVKNPDAWELIINKQTGQWGLTYDANQDLGRLKMQMSKPAATIERLKYTVSSAGGNKGKLTMEWENHIASVPLEVR